MSDHADMQLLLQSLSLLSHLEEDLWSEMAEEDRKETLAIRKKIVDYFRQASWHIDYDYFRGWALCTQLSSTTEKREEEK